LPPILHLAPIPLRQTSPYSAPRFLLLPLTGVFRYTATYPAALSLLSSGTLGPGIAKMVTQRYSLEDAYKAFEDLSRGKDEKGEMVIKCMVGPDYE
jgi:L-iditol 2-dehydrogenase